jgi:hypothetical protein
VTLDLWVLVHTGPRWFRQTMRASPSSAVMSDMRELAIRAEPGRVLCSGNSFKQISARFDGTRSNQDGMIVAVSGERTTRGSRARTPEQ